MVRVSLRAGLAQSPRLKNIVSKRPLLCKLPAPGKDTESSLYRVFAELRRDRLAFLYLSSSQVNNDAPAT